jgi:hypothetical protein
MTAAMMLISEDQVAQKLGVRVGIFGAAGPGEHRWCSRVLTVLLPSHYPGTKGVSHTFRRESKRHTFKISLVQCLASLE